MSETETRPQITGHHSIKQWLKDEVRLSLPRYWLLLAAGLILVLALIALD